MASPLRWFRKNEKILLGVFGVGLMFVFTLSIGSGIDPIIDWLTGGGVQTSSKSPLVAQWKGGAVSESDMMVLRQNRNMMIQYLMGVQQQASMRGRTPQAEILPRVNNERSLVELALLHGEASKRGIVVTDEAVLNYLTMLSGGSMQPAEFLQLWQTLTRGRGTERQLNALLRRELMAARMRGLAWSGTRAASPVAFWDFFNRLEKRIDAEMMAIDVADFVDQVSDPKDGELETFYADYKDKHADPGSPDPGFRQRRRLAFDYIRFDFQDYLDLEKQSVTDDEVAEYYEENKQEFIRTLPEDDLSLENDQDDIGDENADNEPTTEAPAEPNAETGEAEMEQAPATDTTAKPPADETDASTTNADDAVDTQPEPEATPSPTPDAQEEPAATETAKQTTTDPAAAAEDTADEGTDGTDNNTAEEPADDMNESDAAASSTEENPADKEEYKPLSEVTDDIRRAIAAPRAQEKMTEAIRSVQSRMNRYYKQYVMYAVRKNSDESQEPPEMPTFDDISEEPAVIVSSIPLSDRFEVSQFELGQAVEFEFLQDRILRIPFAQIVYKEKTIPAYQPRKFPSADVSPQFVYWLVGQEEAHTPELADIRNQVVETWKMRKAADLALQAAEEQAKKAGQTPDKTLAEATDYPNAETFQTGEISWLTGGNLPMGGGNTPRFSEIPGVDLPSEELYQSLFRLKPGGTAAAMNRPRTVAYVMRASQPTPTTEDRQQLYLANGINTPSLYPIIRTESQRVLSEWYDELSEGYGLKWNREPQNDIRWN